MLAAIIDGTLVPGERLNDDELVPWLGVSRTPIREAIAKLHTWGVVEMEANRYTRVASKDPALFLEAARFLTGLHDLAAGWGDTAVPAGFRKQVDAVAAKVAKKDASAPNDLLDAFGVLVAATGNEAFIGTELPLRTRVKFLSSDDPADYDWAALAVRAKTLTKITG